MDVSILMYLCICVICFLLFRFIVFKRRHACIIIVIIIIVVVIINVMQ